MSHYFVTICWSNFGQPVFGDLMHVLFLLLGVGDLYTDPQIHTANGDDYGEANLGPRGMALFFSTHKCNRYGLPVS